MSRPRSWWQDAVIYQIYPWSFADGDGDGVGDLVGAAVRLPYVASLGVDAVWVCPIYPNGRADWGYDVTDYRGVDPLFGGMETFDRFLAEAHRLGLRLLLDFVPNHTSNLHPWFAEASSSRDSPRRDWYIWADGRDDGREPPNNWESSFGGSAWQWHEPTGQWYLASFFPEQCDLDWGNPAVRAEVIGAMRFWVDRGVDGFRIDVVQRLAKDRLRRDNPGEPEVDRVGQVRRHRVYDEDRPQVHDYLREIRAALGERVCLLGEVWLLDQEAVHGYLRPGELDLAFDFSFSTSPWNPRIVADEISTSERLSEAMGSWPCYHLSNHDQPRHGTRFGEHSIRAAAVLLLTLRGTPVLYYGEEIGMVDGVVPPERLRDRAGRDGCRTPMQWDSSPNAGFCPEGVEPWLPVAPGWETSNVEVESSDPDSVLSLHRRLLALRRSSSALRWGTYRTLRVVDGCFAYSRETEDGALAVACNFTPWPAAVTVPAGSIAVSTSIEREGEIVAGRVELEAGQAIVVRMERPQSGSTGPPKATSPGSATSA